MNIYFAGCSGDEVLELCKDNKLSMLYSYYNDKRMLNNFFDNSENYGNLFVDSGAFTSWSKGVSIDVDEYISYLNNNDRCITLCASLDSIAGRKGIPTSSYEREQACIKTFENYLYMRDKLKSPEKLLYTFHIGENFDNLRKNIDSRDANGNFLMNYIALGGTVGQPMSMKEDFFNKSFKIIHECNNKNVKIHAFGMTSINLLKKYPFTSADSTVCIMAAVNGEILSKFGRLTVSSKQINRPEHITHIPKESFDIVCNEVKKYGYNLNDLYDNTELRTCYNMKWLYDFGKNYKCNFIKDKRKKLF